MHRINNIIFPKYIFKKIFKDAPHSEVAPGIVELGGDLSNDNFANNNENIKEGWSPNPKVRGNRKENNIGIGSF
jgi:hypothetical protein